MSDQKRYEVEHKYRLTEKEFDQLPERLCREMDFNHLGDVVEADTFMPVENPGDIIRVRDERCGEKMRHILCQKKWVMVDGSRERQEKEEELTQGVRDCLLEVTKRLNRGSLPQLTKKRSLYQRQLEGGPTVVVTLDTLTGIGSHSGHYMEIEIIVTRDRDLVDAHRKVDEMALTLLWQRREPCLMSYKQMLDDAMAKV
jgi:adenylate cyclase class IV